MKRDFGNGRYGIVEAIGEGGVGTVYRATQDPLGRTVALKVLKPEFSTDPILRRRFAREARAVAALNHPNIATIFDFGAEPDGTLYIAMEFIEGLPLSAVMGIGVTPQHLLAILAPIVGALGFAHARGVVHRDLKPDNVLVGYVPGEMRIPSLEEIAAMPQLIKLVDFGIASVRGNEEDLGDTRIGQVVGTPLYMAPEQARGERVLTGAVDIYAMGLVLFEGLAGRHPFATLDPHETPMDIMIKHVTEDPPPLRPPPHVYVPQALHAVVRRSLAKDPAERFGSAARLGQALAESRTLLDAHMALATSQAQEENRDMPSQVVSFGKLIQFGRGTTGGGSRYASGERRSSHLSMVRCNPPRPWPRQTYRRLFGTARPPEEPNWAVLKAKMHFRTHGVRFDVPLVGREPVRRQLEAAVNRCVTQHMGQVVLLEGETGIGKTKLLTWVLEWVSESGQMRGLSGTFLRDRRGSLRGVREAMSALFGIRGMDKEEGLEKIRSMLARWRGEGGDDALELHRFIEPCESDDRRWSQRTPYQQEALFALLVRTFEKACQRRPILIHLDDVHWAGREFAEFLEYLAVEFRYRPCPLIILCTVRSEDLPQNPAMDEGLRRLSRYSGESVERLTVPPLTEVDARALIQMIMPADSELLSNIIVRSNGNPLHIVQLLHYLYEEKSIEWSAPRALFQMVDGGGDMGGVPPRLADLLVLRFQQLEERHGAQGVLRALMERAAVLGSQFVFEVLVVMLEEEGNEDLLDFVERGIEVLLQENILAQVKGRSDDLLAFKHGLMREVLLERVPGPVEIKRLHRYAAHAKELYYGYTIEVVSEAIANHYWAAGEPDPALKFFLMAAETALGGYHFDAASRLFHRVVNLLTVAQTPHERTLFVLRNMADIDEAVGHFHEAERGYARVIHVALFEGFTLDDDPGSGQIEAPSLQLLLKACSASPQLKTLRPGHLEELIQSMLGLSLLLRQTGRNPMGARFASQALMLAETGALMRWEHAARLELGRCAWERGDYGAAHEAGEIVLDNSEEPFNRADALRLLADVARRRADPAATAELLTRAREAYEILGGRRFAAVCLEELAQLARARNDLEHAARLFAEARERFEEVGDRHAVARCFNGLGEVARFREQHRVAEGCYRRAFETFRSMDARMDAAISLTNLGMMYLSLNKLADTREAFNQALNYTQDKTDPYLGVGLHLNFALLEALEGHQEACEAHLDEGLTQLDSHEVADPDYARPLDALAQIYAAYKDETTAKDLAARATKMWVELGHEDLSSPGS